MEPYVGITLNLRDQSGNKSNLQPEWGFNKDIYKVFEEILSYLSICINNIPTDTQFPVLI